MNPPLPLIERACARHGGLERWRRIRQLEGEMLELGGLVPLLKGAKRARCRPTSILVAPVERRATIRFVAGEEITFQRGDLIDGADRLPQFRTTFSSLAKKLSPWGPRETAYFFGYALTHYLSLPFALHPDMRESFPITWLRSGQRDGLDWIDVEFPPGSDTHSRRERLWFDATGLLVRHDYHAEILGPGFWGAHHSSDYLDVQGFPLAQRRRVHLRFGGHSTPIPVLDARLKFVAIERAGDP